MENIEAALMMAPLSTAEDIAKGAQYVSAVEALISFTCDYYAERMAGVIAVHTAPDAIRLDMERTEEYTDTCVEQLLEGPKAQEFLDEVKKSMFMQQCYYVPLLAKIVPEVMKPKGEGDFYEDVLEYVYHERFEAERNRLVDIKSKLIGWKG